MTLQYRKIEKEDLVRAIPEIAALRIAVFADYNSLEPFWRRRGYGMLDGGVVRFTWKEHGEAAETEKPMAVWIRDLGSG